jgi:hypothetical protein
MNSQPASRLGDAGRLAGAFRGFPTSPKRDVGCGDVRIFMKGEATSGRYFPNFPLMAKIFPRAPE